MKMTEIIYADEVYAIIGAAMEVYNELGPGFLEPVYQEALELELSGRNILFVPQQELVVRYKGKLLKKSYVADLIAYEKIIIELKALDHLSTKEEAQVPNYLKATGFQLGLLNNFGHAKDLEWKRLAFTRKLTRPRPITPSESANPRKSALIKYKD
jgi:GxxExxY protein